MGFRAEIVVPVTNNIFDKIPFEWPFQIDGLNFATYTLSDWLSFGSGLVTLFIILFSVLGVFYGLRVVVLQWLQAADNYDTDKLKEVKTKAIQIGIGWLVLIVGLVVINMLRNIYGVYY